jgi:hypothetical protein
VGWISSLHHTRDQEQTAREQPDQPGDHLAGVEVVDAGNADKDQ